MHRVPRWPLDRFARLDGSRLPRAIWGVCAALALAALGGCGQESASPALGAGDTPATPVSSSAPAAAVDPSAPLNGRQVLERMVAVYRHAQTYADEGVLRHKVQLGQERVDEAADFAMAFERPNKLRMQVYQAGVVCDGEKLRATLADLTGQVLEVAAPAELTLESLNVDPTLAAVVTGGIAGGLPALAMLLSDQALDAFLTQAGEPVLLDPAPVEDQACYRVQLTRPDGQLVVWVDQQDFTLRRLDYPTDAMRKQYANQGEVGELELWAVFHAAQINQPIDPVAFRFEAPAEARRVGRLVMVPEPPPLSELLGKPIGEFRFTDLEGQPVDRQSLAGKVCVLDFWATWCGPCMQSLPNLNKVYQRFRDDDRVRFLAVSIDVSQVDNARVRETFERAGFEIPIVRDVEQQARDTFGIQGIPNLFVLGPDGTVQDNEIGFNPQLATELTERLEKLLAGENIFPDAAMRHMERMNDYRRQFEEQERAVLGETAEVPKAVIAPADEPSQLKLRRLWTFTELKRPGNVLALSDGPGLEKLLVIEGFKGVVELSPKGEKLGQTTWDIPRTSVVSYLRTGGPAGRRLFLGSAGNQSLLHVFDEGWQKQLSYPEGENAELMDASLVDLDGDGKLEIAAGFWGVVGVQAVSLDGQRLWHNRSLENVFRVAVSPADDAGKRTLYCTHSRGSIQPLDAAGQALAEIVVPNRFVRTVTSADLDADGRADLCGLVITNSSQEDAIGIGLDGSELWTYTLPEGVHEEPIEPVQSGDLTGDGRSEWVLAGADGSIHLLAADGRLIDRYHTGKRLCGLAITNIDGRPALVLSTPDGVEAWQVQAP